MKRFLFVIVAAAFFGSCSPAAIPTPEEASAVLDQLVAFAQAGDLEGLCSIGDGNCEAVLEEVGPGSAPHARPIVLGGRVVAANPAAGSIGGRVIEVCGIDGLGRAFRSDILVFRDGARYRAINPVFWSGITIASVGVAEPSPPPSGASPCPAPVPS